MAKDSILSRPSTKESSGKFRQKHPELPEDLGNYDINRQVVLACQMSGGDACMATTFGGLLLLSRHSLWFTYFTKVEHVETMDIFKNQVSFVRAPHMLQ
jgi:hypothetical protein